MEYDSYIFVQNNTWWKLLGTKFHEYDTYIVKKEPYCERCSKYITRGNYYRKDILCNTCFWVRKNKIIKYILQREIKYKN